MSRIAILAHSVNPRGGVAHALALGDALARCHHTVTVHAPDPAGAGFFRPSLCRAVGVAAAPAPADLAAMVAQRVEDYLRHFATPAGRAFDVFHAQDSLSGNALAELKRRGLIAGFCRTVHHLDNFADPRLTALQCRAVTAADRHFVVSEFWRARLAAGFGIQARKVGNGVDGQVFNPHRDGREDALRQRIGLGGGPVYLSVGGIEQRKNSRRLLAAFRKLRARLPGAQLVIAGGATLLDHRAYQAGFAADLAAARLPGGAVVLTGALPQAEMPALYRLADALVFPSLVEGFGLTVLEAMASGLPVVVSRIPPFTEYLAAADAVWCDPEDPGAIATAMAAVLRPERRAALVRRGARVAARHGWDKVAAAHLAVYRELETEDA